MRFVLLCSAFVAAVLGASLPAKAADDAAADALLAKSKAALGGDAIFNIKSMHVLSDVTVVGIKGKEEQWFDLAGGRFSEVVDAGPASGSDGFDGQDVWQKDASGIVQVQGSREARIQAFDQAFLNGFALWAPDHGGATVQSLGDKTLDGATYSLLRVTPRDGTPIELWFDQRGLPRRAILVLGAQTYTQTLDDYRPVAGAMFPRHIYGTTDTGNATDLKTLSIVANPADIAARLRKPVSDAHDFSIEGGQSSTSVPFDLVDNHVYVDVKLNGKGPYHFIFDSGGANVVDPAVLKELGGSAEGNLQGSGVGAQTEASQFAKVATLEIGEAKLTDQNFVVLPVRAGFGVGAGLPVDGLIGYEVLARYVTTNDYERRRVILRLPTSAPATAFGSAVPFVFAGNTPQVTGSIDGVPAEMTVDTGSRAAISIFRPFAQAHPAVMPSVLTEAGVNGFGVGGASLGRLGRVANLQIGPYTIANSIGDFSVQEKGAFADPYTAGNVGGAVWRRFALTFDYPHQTLYLAPNASFSHPEAFDRSGLFIINRNGKATIYGVRAGTPGAAAGLAKGDVIETVDGKPAAKMSLADIRSMLSGPAGTRVRMTVLSGAATKPADLMLKDYV